MGWGVGVCNCCSHLGLHNQGMTQHEFNAEEMSRRVRPVAGLLVLLGVCSPSLLLLLVPGVGFELFLGMFAVLFSLFVTPTLRPARAARLDRRAAAEELVLSVDAASLLPAWSVLEPEFGVARSEVAAAGLSPEQLEVLEVLAAEFSGTLGELVETSRSLV